MRPAFAVLAVFVCAASMQSIYAADNWTMEWDGARLTVRAIDAPLGPLLEDIGKATGILVHGEAAASVTADFRTLPLKSALEIILSSANVGYGFVEFTEEGESDPRLAVALGKPGTAPAFFVAAPRTARRILPEEERMQQQIRTVQPTSGKSPAGAAADGHQSDLAEIQRQETPEVTVILDGMPLDPTSVPGAAR